MIAFSTSFLQGCATTGGETLSIRTQHVTAQQSMSDEIADLLSALEYNWIPVTDSHVRHGVKVAEQDGEYRMLFQHLKNQQVRIDVRIRRSDDFTRLHFYYLRWEILGSPLTFR